jgi:hypothetical protein
MRPLAKTLGTMGLLMAVFSVSFFFLYQRAREKIEPTYLILTPAVINKPLPKADLINISGKLLDDERLRRGKVVLVFTMPDCPPCNQENEFLKTVGTTRKDVTFFDIIPFGDKSQALKSAQGKYAFETFFDDGSMLSRSLQLYQVPLIVFVEDGIIKRTFLSATIEKQQQTEFEQWLRSL